MVVSKPVFLVGMMGAGKTRCGRRLASALHIPFFDMDHAIEAQQQKTVSELFASLGENAFRRMEHAWLTDFTQSQQAAVVSTGGGAPCFLGNMDLMNRAGITIWLNPSLDELVDRLWRNRAERPKIASLTDEDALRGYIETLLAERSAWYGQAKMVVGDAPPDMDWLVSEVHKLL